MIDETSSAFTLCDHYLFGGCFGTAIQAAATDLMEFFNSAREKAPMQVEEEGRYDG